MSLTPMMQQYMEIKENNKESILFFRLGDFYEMFFDDAILASKELEITLTGKDCGLDERAPMCGVPYHAAESYIAKLISKGYKVSICEQVEDPKVAKGIVKRDIIRVITPGTVIENNMLDEKKNNYIASVYSENEKIGIAYSDVSTGDFILTIVDSSENIIDEFSRYCPTELISTKEFINNKTIIDKLKKEFNLIVTDLSDWVFEEEFCVNRLKSHFSVFSLNSFGIENSKEAVIAGGALLEYLYQTQKTSLMHINDIKFLSNTEYMILDNSARRNLELTETLRDKKRVGTLLWVIDKTNTSMGARMLRSWLEQPLIDSKKINYRLDAVEELFNDISFRESLKTSLNNIYDIERICSKISYGTVNPKDMIALKNSLIQLPYIKELLKDSNSNYINDIYKSIDVLEDIKDLIERGIEDDPPFTLKDGRVIKLGYDKEVDEYRNAALNGKEWLADIEEKEKLNANIKNLKVGFNKVFGYFIEVSKGNLNLVPERYIRKQTLSNCERFITPELKEIEEKILGAEEKLISLEYNIFTSIRAEIEKNILRLQTTSKKIAEIDCLYSLAEVAFSNRYTRPKVSNDQHLDIKDGKHPVVEKMLGDNSFVPNDCKLDCEDQMISLITGPNMAGKSTFMRQVALITLLAQIGSFVPAEYAHIGTVDRIFTRVGASDDLGSGQSTFMVEMTEVANILNNATKNSLLILDEIGRGTSTFDGMSIAWAVIEYISERIGAKTLFSTHYHELVTLESLIRGLKNYSILVKEDGEDIVFLRKIIAEASSSSYGIQVAKLAGLPYKVTERAKVILGNLENKDMSNEASNNKNLNNVNKINDKDSQDDEDLITINKLTEKNLCDEKHDENQEVELKKTKSKKKESLQLDIFDIEKINIIRELQDIDMMNVTPIEAVNKLYDLWQKAKKI